MRLTLIILSFTFLSFGFFSCHHPTHELQNTDYESGGSGGTNTESNTPTESNSPGNNTETDKKAPSSTYSTSPETTPETETGTHSDKTETIVMPGHRVPNTPASEGGQYLNTSPDKGGTVVKPQQNTQQDQQNKIDSIKKQQGGK